MVSPGMPNMQMLNFNNILNVKDSRWLQLEVCREFQRNKCSRPDTECKFAHPPVNVEVQNGRVTACYDSIKGRCNREKPPCKYFHPPQHLKDQLLINGRNHLALKNAFMTQIQGLSPSTQLVHGTLPVQQTSPYLAGIPTMANFNPYISSPVMTVGMTEAVGSPLTGVLPQQVVPAQKLHRTDRLEAFPGMGIPYKRPAPDKTGVPVYQPPGNAAYQQALMQQLGGQSYVPVSCEYGGSNSTTNALALPPPNADASTHSPPITHNTASSSTQLETPPSSSMTYSTTYSTPSSYTTSSSTSTAVKASSIYSVSSASPSLPSNVLSYTGYALNKGHNPRPAPVKVSTAPSYIVTQASAVPTVAPTAFSPGMVTASALSAAMPGTLSIPTSVPGISYSMGVPTVAGGLGIQMPGGVQMMAAQSQASLQMGGFPSGLGPAGLAMAQAMGGMSAAMPPMFPQLIYPASSSLFLPQFTALSNNPQYSWAQAGEQPYKKLKTS